jgi:23S rRNA (pseudouridine1915-N3)-methyltransferase
VKLLLLAVGKIREHYVREALDDFGARLERYMPFETREIAASSGADPERAKREEGERVLRALAAKEPVWLLERSGTQLSSLALAQALADQARAGTARLTIVVAGTFGASAALIERADFCWSLSELTFLHEWARALVVEQLYRAAKISRNEPYHH